MTDRGKHFQTFLDQEVDRIKGSYYPVRASFLRRVLTRRAGCRKLHPNPEDEFCVPGIGPNYGIIAGYAQDFRQDNVYRSGNEYENGGSFLEPLIVQKARPDGYIILNGHHRWAAAMQVGVRRVKIRIVNVTQMEDIHKMLEKSGSDKRVALDLDEVVFCGKDPANAEKAMRFPLNRIYKERVRKGIPALLHYFNGHGYDIWVYTSEYYSMEYIQYYFRHLNVRLTGIVTGTGRKGARTAETAREMKNMVETKYRTTIHIDNKMLLCTRSASRESREYPLSGSPETWGREVIETLERISF